jgi:hypothetical protein
MRAKMPVYKIYLLDNQNHITGRKEVFCASHAEAAALARADHSPHDLEIWTGVTLVGRIKAAPLPLSRAS